MSGWMEGEGRCGRDADTRQPVRVCEFRGSRLSWATAELILGTVQLHYTLVTTAHVCFILLFYLVIFILSDAHSNPTRLRLSIPFSR